MLNKLELSFEFLYRVVDHNGVSELPSNNYSRIYKNSALLREIRKGNFQHESILNNPILGIVEPYPRYWGVIQKFTENSCYFELIKIRNPRDLANVLSDRDFELLHHKFNPPVKRYEYVD